MSKWKFLEDLTKEMNLTQVDLAKRLGWYQTRVSELFLDKANIPARKIYDVANFFGLDYKELKDYNEGKTDKIPSRTKNPINKTDIVKIDILDVSACCGEGTENFTENVIGQQMMTLPALRELTTSAPENIKIIKAIGESMLPTIHPNDVVWIDISVTSPTSDGLYAIIVGSDLMIKRIQINPFDNSATIKSDNTQYATFINKNYNEVRVIGRVIYHMKRMS